MDIKIGNIFKSHSNNVYKIIGILENNRIEVKRILANNIPKNDTHIWIREALGTMDFIGNNG
jgi:hypothetical protein